MNALKTSIFVLLAALISFAIAGPIANFPRGLENVKPKETITKRDGTTIPTAFTWALTGTYSDCVLTSANLPIPPTNITLYLDEESSQLSYSGALVGGPGNQLVLEDYSLVLTMGPFSSSISPVFVDQYCDTNNVCCTRLDWTFAQQVAGVANVVYVEDVKLNGEDVSLYFGQSTDVGSETRWEGSNILVDTKNGNFKLRQWNFAQGFPNWPQPEVQFVGQITCPNHQSARPHRSMFDIPPQCASLC